MVFISVLIFIFEFLGTGTYSYNFSILLFWYLCLCPMIILNYFLVSCYVLLFCWICHPNLYYDCCCYIYSWYFFHYFYLNVRFFWESGNYLSELSYCIFELYLAKFLFLSYFSLLDFCCCCFVSLIAWVS